MVYKVQYTPKRKTGFSLVEVVVSLGIFVIAVVAVIGLLAPINQSISDVRDEDDAGRVAQIIQSELQKVPFASVQSFIANNTVLYANRAGTVVAPGNDTVKWDTDKNSTVTPDEDAAKFFEVRLSLNSTLSPGGTNAATYEGGYLAFSILMRWPGYTGEGVPFSQPQQQSLRVIPAAITR